MLFSGPDEPQPILTTTPTNTLNEFLSCDWGTSTFRLRRISLPALAVMQEIKTSRGIRTFVDSPGPHAHDPTARAARCAHCFAEQVDALALPPGTSVLAVVSGMAGSSIGWKELPYARAPFALDGSNVVMESLTLQTPGGVSVTVGLVSGVQTESEMMRGEETEMIGLFADGRHAAIARDGTVVLPGTHSKHVRLREGRIVELRTFMTGELFDVLASHSVLRASLDASATDESGATFPDQAAQATFVDGVIMARDRGLAPSLFQVRTRTVLQRVTPVTNRWFLSGLLIGAELAGRFQTRSNSAMLLAALPPLSDLYHLALRTLSPEVAVEIAAPDDMRQASIRGHALLRQLRLAS